MVKLVDEVKELYDKPPVQEQEKQRVARELLERIHAATHLEMDSADAAAEYAAILASRRRFARREADARESARAQAAMEEYELAQASGRANREFEKSPG